MTIVADPPAAGEPVVPPPPPRRARSVLRAAASWRDIRATPYGVLPIALLALTGLFQTVDSQVFVAAGPDYVHHFGISIDGIIHIEQIVGLLTAVAAVAVGFYADRHRRLPLLGIGTCLSGITGFISGFGRTTLSVGAPRAADDVANAVADVPYYSLIADYYPSETRGRVFALSATLSRVATIIALPVGAGLVAWVGLGSTFLVLGVPIFVMGVLLLVFLREPIRGYFDRQDAGLADDVARVEDDPLSFGEAWRATFAIRTLRLLFYSQIIAGIALAPIGLFYIFFLSEKYSLNFTQRAFIGLPALIVGLLGAYLGGGLVDYFARVNPVRTLTVYGAFSIFLSIPYVVYALEPPLWVIVVMSCIAAFASALVGPAVNAIYSAIIPANIRTQGLSVLGLYVIGGTLVGFPVFEAVRRTFGYPGVFLGGAPLLLIAGIVQLAAAPQFIPDRRRVLAATRAAEDWREARETGSRRILVCRDVDVDYNGVQVLFGVDFDVDAGETIALLGTNGAGKSTLLRAISGTREASSGSIVFDGREITHSPPNENARRGVINVPGGRGVFPTLTVRENLLLGAWMIDDPAEVRAALADVLEIFPILRSRASVPASALSGGEQQMLSLAQAFLGRPKLLMIDELSLGLSPAVVAELVEIVKSINARGTTIIVVEQSVNVALTIATRAVFMEKGEIKFDGSTADLLARPDILRAVYVKGTGALTDAVVRAPNRPTETGRPILEVSGLTKRFGGVAAVDGLDLEVPDGAALGVIGPNGSGKTTLFELISGYLRPDAGTIRYEGADITDLPPEERAQRRLIRRFQDARLFPSLTVHEAILVSLESRHEARNPVMAAMGLPQTRRAERRLRTRADRLVELLDLGAYRDKFVRELSTGLCRIVDLACVLATEPRLLLLDEPSTGIAQAEAEGLGPLLRRVRHETGCTMMIIEHDIPLISSVADELLVLVQGRILTRGAPETALNDERVIEAYLGTTEATVRRSGTL